MLRDFILANRERIIERTQQRRKVPPASQVIQTHWEHGIPLFLSQLTDALVPASTLELHLVDATDTARADANQRIRESATLHGKDLQNHGFTIGQVVYGYGDVCQVVTELAGEEEAAISPEDFHVFNRCVDDAIAGAVTAYSKQRERKFANEGTERPVAFMEEAEVSGVPTGACWASRGSRRTACSSSLPTSAVECPAGNSTSCLAAPREGSCETSAAPLGCRAASTLLRMAR
jgi:hypothetical protein